MLLPKTVLISLLTIIEISGNEYSREEQRTLAGIRYEMKLRDFSLETLLHFARTYLLKP